MFQNQQPTKAQIQVMQFNVPTCHGEKKVRNVILRIIEAQFTLDCVVYAVGPRVSHPVLKAACVAAVAGGGGVGCKTLKLALAGPIPASLPAQPTSLHMCNSMANARGIMAPWVHPKRGSIDASLLESFPSVVPATPSS